MSNVAETPIQRVMALIEERLCIIWLAASNRDEFEKLLVEAMSTTPSIEGVRHGKQTHCVRGHPFSGDNLHVRVNGQRVCKECKRDRNRRARAAVSAKQ